MRNIDTSAYSSTKASRIKPEKIDLGSLPPIEKPSPLLSAEANAVSTPLPSVSPLSPQTEESVRNSERFSERTEFRTVFRSEEQPSFLPRKRRTTRYSFEFYEDQIFQLKELKHRAEMSGEKVTLSDFAREALDKYLEEKREK